LLFARERLKLELAKRASPCFVDILAARFVLQDVGGLFFVKMDCVNSGLIIHIYHNLVNVYCAQKKQTLDFIAFSC